MSFSLIGGVPPVQSHSFVGSVNQPVVADTEILGVSAPPQGVYLPNPVNPVFRLSMAHVSDETPHHRLVASDRRVQELEQAVAATRQTISALCDGGIPPPQSASSLSRDLEDVKRSSQGESRPPFITAWGFVIFQAICCFYAWPARSFASRRRPCIRWSI